MAAALWGKVYYSDNYAGELRQEPGGRCIFTYDPTYIEAARPSIAFTLPRRAEPYVSEHGLHSFFDNLVAEGWLRNAQARALKVDRDNRFALLLAFGRDCAGAVSVIDPSPIAQPSLDLGDTITNAALAARASLSGIQPKLLAVREGRRFRPARSSELSTYIAKRPSGTLRDIVENEYLTTIANAALLPDDETAQVEIGTLDGLPDERVLLVKRFDRLRSGSKRHFEEFNQLLGRGSGDDKYDASYEVMAKFILETPGCMPADAWRLYRRILVCFLTGNTDAHLKNFAMFHVPNGMRLTPAYDLVAAALYPDFSVLALAMGNAANMPLTALKPKHLVALGKAYGLDQALVEEAIRRRHGLKLTQKQLSALAKVSTPTVSRFEQNDEDIQLSSVLAILDVLGMTDKRTLVFADERFHSDIDERVIFWGQEADKRVKCIITREALDDHFSNGDRLRPEAAFKKYRSAIEALARKKYLLGQIEQDGSILIRTEEIA